MIKVREGLVLPWVEVSVKWVAGGPAAAQGSQGSGVTRCPAEVSAWISRGMQQHGQAEQQWKTPAASPGHANPCNTEPILPPGQWASANIRLFRTLKFEGRK